MEPCISCLYLTNIMKYVSVFIAFKKQHNDQEYYWHNLKSTNSKP